MLLAHNSSVVLINDTHKLLCDFDIVKDHLISSRKTRPNNNQQKKDKLAKTVYFCCPGDHRIKLKEC